MAGELLKKRREDLGLSVKEVAETLKIRADYLSAIESDSFDKLPVPVYTVGYIRSYAKYLDVDSEPIVRYYSEHLAQPKTAAIMPVAFSRRRNTLLYFIMGTVSAAVILCVLFVVYYSSGKGVGSKPIAQPANAPAEHPAQTRGVLHRALPRAASQEETPPVRQHVLNISAEETTWLSIRFSDGKIEEALLRPGESRIWKFSKEAIIRIGNAGGVSIKFDGTDIGTPGSTGEVVTMTLPGGKKSGPTSP